MQQMLRRARRGAAPAIVIACAVTAIAAGPAQAQYVAPPPDPGFEYIFDGSATGSDASFDKWIFASSTIAASATQGRATLDPAEGSFLMGASPFGAYWYPVRPLGDAVLRFSTRCRTRLRPRATAAS